MSVTAICAGIAMALPSEGGLILDHYDMAKDLTERGCEVRIEGNCYSACSMFTGVEGACVHPEARIWFHQPRDSRTGKKLPTMVTVQAIRIMAQHMPDGMAQWWINGPSRQFDGWVTITGAEIINQGWMEKCE